MSIRVCGSVHFLVHVQEFSVGVILILQFEVDLVSKLLLLGSPGLMKNLFPLQGELLGVQLVLFQTHQCVL